ncbi:MAG: GGDEF domain-containing protein [Lachnospiraceae bacterium]|uniref:GGDEF domain-containing protein n=1 Tax=Candidatus Weimeria bifida TaxID=2599074 RepID=A0A6N7IZL5_9FIRM|nr:GGDEF domain-containing protein [Candidatus Weimeria bifida]RRF96544.1 MAG: GGDEF domain-containing protein [Lachnospiraceae bacterium]
MEKSAVKKNTRIFKYTKKIIAVFLFAFAAFLVINVIWFFLSKRGGYSVFPIDKGWQIKFQGRTYSNVSLDDKRFINLDSKKNDVITMKKKIDIVSKQNFQNRLTLRVYSRLSSLRVSVIEPGGKEELLYYYGYDSDNYRTKDFLGSGYHFIQLPQRNYGVTLKIMEMASEDGAIVSLPEVQITPSNNTMENFVQERSVGTFISLFLILAGAVLTCAASGLCFVDPGFVDLALIGLFSGTSGMWSFCSMKSIELFTQDIRVDSLVELLSLYIFSIPLLALVLRTFKKISAFYKISFSLSILLDASLFIAAIICQRLYIANVNVFLLPFHLIILFDVIVLELMSIKYWRKSSLSGKFFEGSVIVIIAATLAYLIYFYFSKTNGMGPNILERIIIPLELITMVVLILIGYVLRLYEKRYNYEERAKLRALAYHDDLTGLSNRNSGEETLSALDSVNEDYLIINMDLNFLKKTNDKFGHAGGDLYLKTFGKILRNVFSDAGIICRMGGDEFMVVYDKNIMDEGLLEERFERMKNLERQTSASLPINITVDAAYGYAYSDELKDASGEDIYRLADQRMYQMKFESRKGRGEC